MDCIKCKAPLPVGAIFCPMCGKKQSVQQKPGRAKSRGNGTGSVYKRGDKWVAAVTLGYRIEGNKKKRVVVKKCGFRTKKEALEYLPMLKGQQKREKDITWQQLYDLWLPTHRAGASTMSCYKSAEKYFSPVAFRKMKDIDIDDLQECMDDCPKGKRTKQLMKTLSGLLYKYAVPRDYAKRNLSEYLTVSGESSASRSSFSAEQLEQIRRAAGVIPYADYIYCMCYLGFRPSEFLALDVKDYDRQNRTLTGGAKTEAGKNRIVTISPKIQPIIDRLVKNRIAGALFCGENGEAILYDHFRDDIFYPTLDAIGIANPMENGRHKLSPHTCRHTFATLMKNINAADKDKLELIGHTSTEMLRYYQDVNVEDLRRITDAL